MAAGAPWRALHAPVNGVSSRTRVRRVKGSERLLAHRRETSRCIERALTWAQLPTVTVRKGAGQGVMRWPRYPQPQCVKELLKLKKELAKVTLERDILKKAAAYFAKEAL